MKNNYNNEMLDIIKSFNGKTKSILLHSCCGPCSSYVISKLTDFFDITVLYYNPNIEPYEEYLKRKNEQIRFINEFKSKNKLDFLDCDYDNSDFKNISKDLEFEPEGGKRCHKCYELRLLKTALLAKEKEYDFFGTTLSVSPYKNANVLNEIGKDIENKLGINFLVSDFKKEEGYKKSIAISKEYNLYRQNYCGCSYTNLNIYEELKNLEKVELHLHLDGSMSLDLASKLSGKSVDTLKNEMASNNENSLADYLKKFDLPISLMQTKENLMLVAKELIKTFKEENVIYAEVRFAPMFHTQKGLSYDEIVESVIKGLKSKDVKTNVILCMMRGFSDEENLKTIECAKRFLNKGVCAIDIAGDEESYPIENYQRLFDYAKKLNIPFTIHSGECTNEVTRVVTNYDTKRMGHGIKAINDENVIKKLIEKDILLEVCPKSNIDTNNVSDYQLHPIKELFLKGVKVCINTDNKTVSNINLNDEYYNLYRCFNFTVDDFNNMNIDAIKHSFISDEEKQILVDKLLKK